MPFTNHTGHDRQRRSTIDLLQNAPGVTLVALFSPEHRIRGAMDENIRDGVDEKTGLPIHSLYGQRRAPSPEQLRGLEALVFDIQDIGCRFYTYTSTMGLCLEAAGRDGDCADVAPVVSGAVRPREAESIVAGPGNPGRPQGREAARRNQSVLERAPRPVP